MPQLWWAWDATAVESETEHGTLETQGRKSYVEIESFQGMRRDRKNQGRLDQGPVPSDPPPAERFVQGRGPVELDPLRLSCQESSNELLQYKELNYLFCVLLLHHQPPATRVLQLM